MIYGKLLKFIIAIVISFLLLSCVDENKVTGPDGGMSDYFRTEGYILTDAEGRESGIWGVPPPEHPDFGDVENPIIDSTFITPKHNLRVSPVFPNPSNPPFIIQFSSGQSGVKAKISVVRTIGPSDNYESFSGEALNQSRQYQTPYLEIIHYDEDFQAGTYMFHWNARDQNGNILPDGFYRIFVEVGDYVWWTDAVNSKDGIILGRNWGDES